MDQQTAFHGRKPSHLPYLMLLRPRKKLYTFAKNLMHLTQGEWKSE